MTTATLTERRLVTQGNPDSPFPTPTAGKLEGVDFLPADDLEKVGRALIKAHEELRHLKGVEITYLWKEKGGNKGGKATLGKCVLASGLVAHFSKATFVVWLGAENVREAKLSNWQVEALLHHELAHAVVDDGDDGPEYSVRSHDFEGFTSEVRRYGLWKRDLEGMARTAQLHLPGLQSEGEVVDLAGRR